MNANVRDTGISLVKHLAEGHRTGWERAMEACRNCNVYSLELWAAACKWAKATEVENVCSINAWANCVKAAAQLCIDSGKGAPDNVNALNLRNVLVALLIWQACETMAKSKPRASKTEEINGPPSDGHPKPE